MSVRRTIAAPVVISTLFLLTLVAGCTATGKSAIPQGADEVTSGRGVLRHTVQRDGRIWVYDGGTDKMVYTGTVRDGDKVVVDPDTNQITVGGTTVSEQPLVRDHKYRIYFKRHGAD